VSQLLALAEQIVVKAVSEKSANGGIIDFNQLIAEQSKAHRLNETERNTLIPLVNKGYINKTNMLDFDIATPSGVAAYLYNPKSATLNKSASVSETVDYTFPETSLDLASVATAELSTKQASTTEQNEDNRIFPKGCHGVNVTKLLKSANYNELIERQNNLRTLEKSIREKNANLNSYMKVLKLNKINPSKLDDLSYRLHKQACSPILHERLEKLAVDRIALMYHRPADDNEVETTFTKAANLVCELQEMANQYQNEQTAYNITKNIQKALKSGEIIVK
jgi:hypothetical protein